MNLTSSHCSVHFTVVFLERTNSDTKVKLGHSMNFQIKEHTSFRSQWNAISLSPYYEQRFQVVSVILLFITVLERGGVVTTDDILLSQPKFRIRHLNNLLIQCWTYFFTPLYLGESIFFFSSHRPGSKFYAPLLPLNFCLKWIWQLY